MTAYYNEIDPNAAEWLRQLIKLGAIAPGDVDERDIRDVTPNELTAYTQCHFFAGIGVWSHALRQAGWDDDRPVWTGSCPCQPFSSAGKRKGADDDRDLWWAMFWLIQQCRPETVFGEQVASKDGLAWWDVVQSDLERADYESAAFDLSAGSVGAPHIRQRLYFVASACETKYNISIVSQERIHGDVKSLLLLSPREAVDCVSQGLSAEEWVKARVLRMHKCETQGLLQKTSPGRTAKTNKSKAGQSGRSAVSDEISAKTSSQRLDKTCQNKGNEEGGFVRPGQISKRDSGADRSWCLRNDRNVFQLEPGTDIQQSVFRPHQPERGVHLQEHSYCMSLDELLFGRLGRRDVENRDEKLDSINGKTNEIVRDGGRSISSRKNSPESGESVASSKSLVQCQVERASYPWWESCCLAPGIGAPHIRQRLFWVADSVAERCECESNQQPPGVCSKMAGERECRIEPCDSGSGSLRSLADSGSQRRQQNAGSSSSHEATHGGTRWDGRESDGDHIPASDGENGCTLADSERAERGAQFSDDEHNGTNAGRHEAASGAGACSQVGRASILADSRCSQTQQQWSERSPQPCSDGQDNGIPSRSGEGLCGTVGNAAITGLSESRSAWVATMGTQSGARLELQRERSSSVSGFWSDAIWLPCADGKARPAKPGAFPLVDGIAADLVCSSDPGSSPHQVIQTEDTSEARTMRLKGYGNAIVGPLATEFISAYMESLS